MSIRFFGFKPPIRINALGEVHNQPFALAAIAGGSYMQGTLRFDNLDVTLKLPIPNDVAEHEVEELVAAALAMISPVGRRVA